MSSLGACMWNFEDTFCRGYKPKAKETNANGSVFIYRNYSGFSKYCSDNSVEAFYVLLYSKHKLCIDSCIKTSK